MAKRLEKVGKIKKAELAPPDPRADKMEALNVAYSSFDGEAVDHAANEALSFLESSVGKDDPLYLKTKNNLWQANHLRVLATVNNLINDLGYMPTTSQIARAAGLSDETIYKHVREFNKSELFKDEIAKFQLLRGRMLTMVFKLGINGDLRAAKIFLDSTDTSEDAARVPVEQNNFIQINNLKITPDELESLPAETLEQIETLIKLPAKYENRNNLE